MPQSPFPCGNSTYCGPVCKSIGCAAARDAHPANVLTNEQRMRLARALFTIYRQQGDRFDPCAPSWLADADVLAPVVADLIQEGHPHVCDYEEGQRDVRERVEAVQARGAIQPAGTLDSEPYVLVADIRAAIAEDAPVQPSVDGLLGADPDWTGGLSVDDYMDQQRRRP